jgi:hypothetical protein
MLHDDDRNVEKTLQLTDLRISTVFASTLIYPGIRG